MDNTNTDDHAHSNANVENKSHYSNQEQHSSTTKTGMSTLDESAANVFVHLDKIRTELQQRIDSLDRQIADLQIDQIQAKRFWYRDVSILIALFAFLFSFGTTVFSFVRAEQQASHDARAELREILKRISEIPRELAKIPSYQLSSAEAGSLSAQFQVENAMLARQAVEIMERIPKDVSASEYNLVANALWISNMTEDSIRTYDKAINIADNANDKVTALRSKAILLFNTSQLAEGRASYTAALAVFQDFPTSNAYLEHSTHATTEINWAAQEYLQGQCELFMKHLKEAKEHVTHLATTHPVVQQVNDFEKTWKGCTPAPATAPTSP
jgi:tetratricopeptide (TPR) repeat protein